VKIMACMTVLFSFLTGPKILFLAESIISSVTVGNVPRTMEESHITHILLLHSSECTTDVMNSE
jgi:hypothetical protein